MLVHTYGLFWKSEYVFWGKQKIKGRLLGHPAKEKLFGDVDFRDQSGIYVLYADYDLVYVGQTAGENQKLLSRLNQHNKDHLSGRWNMFSWFGLRSVLDTGKLKAEKKAAHPDQSTILNQIEAILIHISEPPLNRQGGKWGAGVEQYLQSRDNKFLGPSVPKMIEDLWKDRNKS